MSNTNEIPISAGEEYIPQNERLSSILEKSLDDTQIHYTRQREGYMGIFQYRRMEYEAEFRDVSCEAFETLHDLGRLLSVKGNTELAATIILSNMLIYGVPSLLYTDTGVKTQDGVQEYQDITIEWLHPIIEDNQNWKTVRKMLHNTQYTSNELTINELEEMASNFLLNGE